MNRLWRRNAVLLSLSLFVLVLGVISLAGKAQLIQAGQLGQIASTPTAGPPPTPSPTLSPPTPTPSPPDLALAVEFARQGKIEAAIGAFLAVIDQGTREERLAARLALARVYVEDSRPSPAARQLDAYLLEAPAETDVRAAQYSLAEVLAGEGDWEGALPLYNAYIQSGGGASTYARLGRAEALARLGRIPAALRESERVLEEELPSSVELSFLLTMAQRLEPAQPADALVFYDRLREESGSSADQALALWRSALIRSDLGDANTLPDAWEAVIRDFPSTSTAQTIVDDPPPLAGELDPYYRGLVYFRAGRSDEAQAAFEASFAANRGGGSLSLAARASYFLARLAERAGDVDAAVAGYERVLEFDSRVELADDALWRQGQLLEDAGRRSEAAASYRRLDSDFPGSEHTADARFLLALYPYDDRSFGEAAEEFAAMAGKQEGHERQRALLWQGKALAALGDADAAEQVWQTLREEAPADYYGLRAAVLLGDAGGALEDAGLDEPLDPDWAAIEAWLRDITGEDPSGALEGLLYDEHWGLGQELLALGLQRRAGLEFGLLVEAASGNPGALYQAARFLHSVDMADLSARAATRLLHTVPEEAADEAPGDLWRLAYPAPFVRVLREVVDEEETSDLLLLALIRQESFFDPLAGSPAGALGLAQVIPPTGRGIAEDLGVTDFQVEHLYRPVVSLRFGAHYIQQQLDGFSDNVYYALPAYNGGPGNAQRWRDGGGGDVDRFLEEISFSETKRYVHLVAENLARYRQLYLDLDEPSLPED